MSIDFLEYLEKQGPLWVLFGVIIFGLIKYGPRLIEKHIETLDSISKTQAESAKTMHTISHRVEQAGKFNAAQHRAAIHLGDALIKLSDDDSRERVRADVIEMLRELQVEHTDRD